MEIYLTERKKHDIRYMRVEAHVRYWEDGEVNGVEDVDIFENPDESPKMPGAVRREDGEWVWTATLDLEEEKILEWPSGTEASIHYKVCDEGMYTFLDSDMNPVVEIESYVPDFIGDCGDYIVLQVDSDGSITGGFDGFDQDEMDSIVDRAFSVRNF